MKKALICPRCGQVVEKYLNPFPTVDVIIEAADDHHPAAIVLIRRRNEPKGWALPGGFVDYGESVEAAARREAREETGLKVELLALLGVYSQPGRDPRFHTQTTVFVARAKGSPRAGDDAAKVGLFSADDPPAPLCFDHARILAHYRAWRQGLRLALPVSGKDSD